MNFDFPVKVKRQPRKSISFKLNLDGSLLVKAPYMYHHLKYKS